MFIQSTLPTKLNVVYSDNHVFHLNVEFGPSREMIYECIDNEEVENVNHVIHHKGAHLDDFDLLERMIKTKNDSMFQCFIEKLKLCANYMLEDELIHDYFKILCAYDYVNGFKALSKFKAFKHYNYNSYLQYAFALNCVNMIDFLLTLPRGGYDIDWVSIFHLTISKGNLEFIQQAFENVTQCDEICDIDWKYIVREALNRGDINIVKWVIQMMKKNDKYYLRNIRDSQHGLSHNLDVTRFIRTLLERNK